MCPLSRIPASVSRERQSGVAIEEGSILQILAIVLDEVEGVEDRGSSSLPAAQLFEARHPIGAEHNRLAVDVKLSALIRSAAAAITESLAVRSIALRLQSRTMGQSSQTINR